MLGKNTIKVVSTVLGQILLPSLTRGLVDVAALEESMASVRA